jgi:hypothetical protein
MKRTMIVLMIAAIATMAIADDPPAPAPEAPATGETEPAASAEPAAESSETIEVLEATVVSIEGSAETRDGSDDKGTWRALAAGDTLNQYALIRTGLGATVVLHFADYGEMTVKGATKIGIGEFYKAGGEVHTRVGLKYGSLRASVDTSETPGEFVVETADAALTARGTGCDAMVSELGLGVNGLWGLWGLRTAHGWLTLAGGQTGDGKAALSAFLQRLANHPQLGDLFGGLTEEEIRNLLYNGDGQGLFDFNGGLSTILFHMIHTISHYGMSPGYGFSIDSPSEVAP